MQHRTVESSLFDWHVYFPHIQILTTFSPCLSNVSGLEDKRHFIFVFPTWHHFRIAFFVSAHVFSAYLATKKIELHTRLSKSIWGNQLLLCLNKTHLSRETKVCFDDKQLHNIIASKTTYITVFKKIPLYWYMCMDVHGYAHVHVSIPRLFA